MLWKPKSLRKLRHKGSFENTLGNNIFYRANRTSTTDNHRNKTYYDISEIKFKPRYANPGNSFKNKK